MMAKKKVLILYGTRFGAAQGIAERIAEILEEKDIETEVTDLKTVSLKDLPDFTEFAGLLFGSGIKVGQWTKEVKECLAHKKDELNSFHGAKGFFVSSGHAADPEMYEKVKQEYTLDALEKLGVQIEYIEAFGGLMDFTKSSRMSWLEKKILKQVAKNDHKLDLNGWNDLRDWDKVESFTLGFLELLRT
jgi:menaquinone-dependent protoporphyrinogen IX oxidase